MRARSALPWSAPVGGLVVGAATFGLQGVLPGGWNQLANSGAVWSLATFLLVAWLVPARACWSALAGAATLPAMVIGYYVTATIVTGPGDLYAPTVWLVLGVLLGPVFGTAAAWWRAESRVRRVLAIAVLGGVYWAEGVHLLWADSQVGDGGTVDWSPGWAALVTGLILLLLLGRSGRDRLHGVLVLVPVSVLGYLALLAIPL